MRKITDHVVPGLNEALTIVALDAPGAGGACHRYQISFTEEDMPSAFKNVEKTRDIADGNDMAGDGPCLTFQEGPIKEVGVNGISQEALLAIVIDRLRGFQDGPYASDDNAEALDHVEAALVALHRRTLARIDRGVEGTSVK